MSDAGELILEIRETYRQRQDLQRAELRLELQIQAIRRRIDASLRATGEDGQPPRGTPDESVIVPSRADGSEEGHTSNDTRCSIAASLASCMGAENAFVTGDTHGGSAVVCTHAGGTSPDQFRPDTPHDPVRLVAPCVPGENGQRTSDTRSTTVVVASDAGVSPEETDTPVSVAHPGESPSAAVTDASVQSTIATPYRRDRVDSDRSAEAAFLADFAAMRLIEMRDLGRTHRKQLDRRLEQLARQLPVWAWVDGVRGAGALGLAQIVGEAGDLGNYANPAKLWKRMGLGLVDGERQRRVAGNADLALRHGYSPTRRAVMWVIGDCLIKGNRDGAYRTYYLAEKERQLAKMPEPVLIKSASGRMVDGRKLIAHKRAQRHMEKRYLRDLWRAWTAVGGLSPSLPLPEALATGREARELVEVGA